MKRVLLILPNAFELLEAATFIDVLGWANHYGEVPIETVTAGLRAELSGTFGGLRMQADQLLGDLVSRDFDALALPGGFEAFGFFEEAYDDLVLQMLRDFDESGKLVASICVGALPLGKSGILKGKKAVTYHRMGETRREQLAEFGAEVVDAEVVCDGNKITSTSPASAIEVALELLAQLTTKKNAEKIRYLMGF